MQEKTNDLETVCSFCHFKTLLCPVHAKWIHEVQPHEVEWVELTPVLKQGIPTPLSQLQAMCSYRLLWHLPLTQ